MSTIVNIVGYGFVGALLGSMGYGMTTWQFYAVLVTMVIVQASQALDS